MYDDEMKYAFEKTHIHAAVTCHSLIDIIPLKSLVAEAFTGLYWNLRSFYLTRVDIFYLLNCTKYEYN